MPPMLTSAPSAVRDAARPVAPTSASTCRDPGMPPRFTPLPAAQGGPEQFLAVRAVTVRPVLAAVQSADQIGITDWVLMAPSGSSRSACPTPRSAKVRIPRCPQILADELDADGMRVNVQFVTGTPPKIAFREGGAGPEGRRLDVDHAYFTVAAVAGAAAREVLVRAAAERWRSHGRLPHGKGARHPSTGRAPHLRRAGLRGAAQPCRSIRRLHSKVLQRVQSDRQAAPAARYDGEERRHRHLRHRRRFVPECSTPRSGGRRRSPGAVAIR